MSENYLAEWRTYRCRCGHETIRNAKHHQLLATQNGFYSDYPNSTLSGYPIYCDKCGDVPEEEVAVSFAGIAPNVMNDIQPYESVITGETITSRSQHRRHLKQHGCEEVGNEKPKWMREHQERQAEQKAIKQEKKHGN